ncbi:hypothetical protein N0V82_004405 [Gnomoniopsis sp. IMI 355080]|nr:hypothetical protein N0V82_004405 [Gnomoniopsis sp. IMI 355080]
MSAKAGDEEGGADTTTNNDNDEWTRIVRKGKKRNTTSRKTTPPAAGPVDNFRPNAAPTLSATDIRAEHDQVTAAWRATEACVQLRALMVRGRGEGAAGPINAVAPAACVPVRRAVCLGLGAFDPADGAWVARRRAHVQLAAFLTMVEGLEESGTTGDIECFYQEPRFAQPDKEFIQALGGKVVESPASYALIDESTLVFGVHLYRDIWAAALERSLPAMFVGTGWDVWEESPGAEKSSDFARIRQMEAGAFAKFAFPQDEHHSFSSTCIYWRKRDE